MPHREPEDHKTQAIRNWEPTYKNVDVSLKDAVALKLLLKEAQIAQLALLIENAQLKKATTLYSTDDTKALRILLNALPKAIFVKDIQDDYRILFWNEHTSEFMGTVVEEAQGKTDYELFPEDTAATIRRLDRQASEESLQQSAITYTLSNTFYGIQRSIIKDTAGEPLFIVGSIVITPSDLEEGNVQLKQDVQAIHNAKEPILLFRGKALYACNSQALEIYGLTKEEIMGNFTLLDISPPYQPNGKASERYLYTQIRSFKKEGHCRFYWLHKRQDGSLLHVIITASLGVYGGTQMTRIVVQDITNQVENRITKDKLSLVAKTSQNKIAILNDDGLIEWVSEGFQNMIDYQAEKTIGQHFSNLLNSDLETERILELPVLTDGHLQEALLYEVEGYRQDGSKYRCLNSVTPFVDEHNQMKYLLVESELTEQNKTLAILGGSKQKNNRAERSSDRLKDIERIAHFGHWELDWATKVEYWSDELYNILGYDAQTTAPNRIALHECIDVKYIDQVKTAYDKLWQHQQGFNQCYSLKTAEGQALKYIEEDCKGEFDDNGRLLRVIGIVRDVSERQEQDQQIDDSNQAVSDLEYALNQSTMVLVLDEHKKIISANENFYRHTEYQLEDLLGRDFDMTDPNYHSKWFLKLIWETTETGEVWKGELNSKRKDGEFYWADTAVVPFLDEEQNVNKYIVLQYDITSRKKMEGELERNNEEEFAKLYQQQKRYISEIEKRSIEWDRFFKLSTEMISVVDAEGIMKRINPTFAKALGYRPKELLGQSVFNFIHPDDLEESKKVNKSIQDNTYVMNFVNRWRNAQGEYRWMSWRAVMDMETQISYCVSRDITEKRLANQKVKDFTHTLNQTTLVLVLNKQEEIISVNTKFCETSGFQEEEVIGKKYSDFGGKQEDNNFWAEVHATIRRGKIWQGELQEHNKENKVYWTYTSIVPFMDDKGELTQYIVTQSDITSRKQLEDELREAKKEADKNTKIKEDFLANMSHEIRTPMNGVLGFSRLLLQTQTTDLQHKYAQSIYSSAENLLVIVNDILDVSKIESGTFQLREIPFNLKKRIEEGLSILSVSVQKKNLSFNIEIDPKIPEVILGVPDRLSQVLINLVGNAIKFTKRGYITLSVTLQEDKLLFKVTDTGIGIAENKLEIIFDSFTQAENYTTREYGGTGLGLSISKKLVTVMGGTIGVESILGEGATFFFTLPYKKIETYVQEDPNNEIKTPRADVPLVLVVEDNKVNQELVLIYLNLLECNVHVAENGVEALERVDKYQYDLILMDIQMPKMDGMAATSAIRKKNTKVPIIAMSAHALEREKKRCFEIGMNNYISKPFKVEVLQEVMTKYIKLPTQKEQSAVPRIQYLGNTAVAQQRPKRDSQRQPPIFLSNYTNLKISTELLLLFRDELLKLINNMQEAFRTGNIQRIQRQMHRIKPNFELFDLTDFYDWSDTIDQLATEKAPIVQIKEVYNELERALPRLIERINQEVQP